MTGRTVRFIQSLKTAVMSFAVFLKKQGKLALAEPLYLEAREKLSAIFGEASEPLGGWALNYGALLEAKGDTAGAKESYDRSLAIFTSVLGEDHPVTKRVRQKRAELR